MYLLRANPRGGRPINPKNYPLAWDKQGRMGLKLGYLQCTSCGQSEDFVIPYEQAEELVEEFAPQYAKIEKMVNSLTSRPKALERAKKWLIGRLGGYTELPEREERLIKGESGYFRG